MTRGIKNLRCDVKIQRNRKWFWFRRERSCQPDLTFYPFVAFLGVGALDYRANVRLTLCKIQQDTHTHTHTHTHPKRQKKKKASRKIWADMKEWKLRCRKAEQRGWATEEGKRTREGVQHRVQHSTPPTLVSMATTTLERVIMQFPCSSYSENCSICTICTVQHVGDKACSVPCLLQMIWEMFQKKKKKKKKRNTTG